ncbi:hypothetical protein TNCV_2964341 [Trichonephila clavipes]|nr:hypothetical protein TNCV_2964341 [Trichonephila clavipes]
MGPDYIFMDCNALPHSAHNIVEFLEEDISRMNWTLRSSDLNPIECVWDGLGRAISQQSPLPGPPSP